MSASSQGPVIVIGLDACDPATVRRMAAAGELPVLAGLLAGGSRCRVRNPFGLFVGAIWANFATGVRPDRHGFHCWEKIERASYEQRLSPSAIAFPGFWQALGDAGRRVALVDVPHARFPEAVNGVAVAEWGCHDRHFGFHAQPEGRAAAIAVRFGTHPVLGLDPFAVRDFAPDDFAHRARWDRTPAEHDALASGLEQGVETKRRLLAQLMAEEDWDLFLAVFGESHAVGHQQWHLHDPSHPRFAPAVRRAIGGDPVARVYRALDHAVGDALARAAPDATMLVLLSHGMAAHHDGTHLLDEVLRRLDAADRGWPARGGPRDLFRRGSQALMPAADRLAGTLGMPEAARRVLRRKMGARMTVPAALRARQAWFVAPNNSVYGGIRFNLAGREPDGCVSPDEVEALGRRLAEDLRALVNVDTGRRAIRRVWSCGRFHRRAPEDAMPDLFVEWDRSAPIETVRSPRIGTVRAPYSGWRTGDHRPDGLLFARGPGLPAGRAFPPVAVEDLPVTIAARLGVALPGVDGAAIPWLAGDPAQPAATCPPIARERHS